MQTITSQRTYIGSDSVCLECKKPLRIFPNFALEVTESEGAVEGYLHPVGECRAKWEAQQPGFSYGQPK